MLSDPTMTARYFAGVLPHQKQEKVKELQAKIVAINSKMLKI
jgi:cation transport ATPase